MLGAQIKVAIILLTCIDSSLAFCSGGFFMQAQNCTECDPGHFTPVINMMHRCIACPLNTFTAISGSVRCQPCPLYFHTTRPGSISCVALPSYIPPYFVEPVWSPPPVDPWVDDDPTTYTNDSPYPSNNTASNATEKNDTTTTSTTNSTLEESTRSGSLRTCSYTILLTVPLFLAVTLRCMYV
jgi:hypothetical protein